MATPEKLVSEFPATTHAEWKSAAEKLLKGAPFDKIMLTPTPESITLQPIYEKDTLAALPATNTLPGQDGYLRGTRAAGYRLAPWDIAQEIPYADPATFNKALLSDLEAGQNAIFVCCCGGADALRLTDAAAINTAFQGVLPEAVSFLFQAPTKAPAIAELFAGWLKEQKADAKKIRGAFNYDPVGALARKGALCKSLAEHYDAMATLAQNTAANLPSMTAIGVITRNYHNAGASAVEELGAAIATGVEYLRELMKRGLDIDTAASQIAFNFSIGGHFFMELAKLRAARVLWSRIVAEFGGSAKSQAMRQHARTGLFNKTKQDPYVNILRTTTEALSGVLAGIDSLTVGTFDECVRLPEEFSRRVARNTQVILQEECELTAVIDPAGGSWYIEKLTDDVARAAWIFFREIEAKGGIAAALKADFVQEKIAATRKGKEKLINQRRASLVGTNQYPNIAEKPLPEAAIKNPEAACCCQHGNAESAEKVTALPQLRLAAAYEALRDASAAYKAKTGHGPNIHLANIGALRRHKARADFTRAFFETGGFEIVGGEGSTDAAKIAAAALASGAKIVVICGHDEDYPTAVPAICTEIKSKNADVTLILAGAPGEHEAAYKAAGLDTNISIKSDNYETNKQFLTKIGAL